MSNYVEYKDHVAFHPGYYIREIIEESGMTQEEFARRLDTTPKNLSILIRGEQRLSVDIALKLSKMLGTDTEYWLNLQTQYDVLTAEFKSDTELAMEREILKRIGYPYFRDNFGLPNLPRQVDEQVREVRELLRISSLGVLNTPDLAGNYRAGDEELTDDSRIKANAMVELASNEALSADAPPFNKAMLPEIAGDIAALSTSPDAFRSLACEALLRAGVVLVFLPDIPGSGISGATKRIGKRVVLLVNERKVYVDVLCYILLREIGHILQGNYGITLLDACSDQEDAADQYAADVLIPPALYRDFVLRGEFGEKQITSFAASIDRAPGIVVGRLLQDMHLHQTDRAQMALREKIDL